MPIHSGGSASDDRSNKRKYELLGGVCVAALAIGFTISSAQAANFVASNETELQQAIADAQASSDAASTITLTSSFATTAAFSPINAGKSVTIETGSNTLTFGSAPQFDIANGGTLTVSGQIAGSGVVFEKTGEGELVLDSTGSGISRIGVEGGHLLINGGGEITPVLLEGAASAANTEASLTISGAGTRVVSTGPDNSTFSSGSGARSTVTIEDGAYLRTHGVRINGENTFTVTGAGSMLDAVGFYSTQAVGYYYVRDGGLVRLTSSTNWAGASGFVFGTGWVTAEVSGEGSRWEGAGINMFRGSLSILDGGVMTGTGISIARVTTGITDFSVLVSGAGSELAGDTISVGAGGKGTLTIADDGNVVVGGGSAALVLGGTDADSDAALNIGGAEGEAAAAAGTLQASAVTLAASADINFNHTETGYVFDPPINGSGTINQLAGHTIFNADQAGFTGQSNVNAGTLAVNGVLGGTMNVAGGRLQGTGTVGATTHETGGTIAPGNSIGTLTIAGDYIGNGGLVEIETELGDDSSSTDILRITGDTSGTGNVKVINVGGSGALTSEGIRIIDVDGASNGVFSLNGDYVFEGDQAVVGGAYAYRLYQNGVSTPADGDWYLRSTLASTVSPVVPPVTPPAPPAPLYQPGVPLYESYANVLQSFNTLGTLQQRVGNRSWSGARTVETGEPVDGTIEGNGVWGRIEAAHGNFSPETSTSGAEYDADLWKLQAGVDGLLHDGQSGHLIGGLSVHYGTISSDITSRYGNGSIDSTGYGLGGTLTWYADNGFYLDGQAQVSWHDSDLTSRTAGIALTHGNDGVSYGLSIEGGQKIALDRNWSITPQAQLAYSGVTFDDFTDVFGASVGLDRGSSLKSRFGITADYQNEWQDETGQTSRSHIYGITNLYYEFLDGSKADVAGVKFTSENDPLWGGIGIGGSYNWGDDKYSLFGEASVNTSLRNFGDSYALKANAGLRVKF